MSGKDKASTQLADWKKNQKPMRAENAHGTPVASLTSSMSIGASGPLLFQDSNLLEHLAYFDRERIPERVVHAKGAGAFGYFEVTHDITKYCKAKVFEKIKKRTPVAARFSTVGGESGSPDTVRDPRGFAIKFYTEDGNWDLVGNNTPIFFIRDPILFPSFIHTQKRNPQTHLKDPEMFWDFITLRHETVHQVSFLFSDRGTPDGYRHMNGYGSHTFKMVNKDNDVVYVKFHFKTDQGIKNLDAKEADRLTAQDPDYSIRDLYNAIAEGNPPSWTLYIQTMTMEQAKTVEWNPFDITKVWSHSQFPLQQVGKLVLDRNPKNYFAEVEQIAFSPANMIPGIEASPDKMLQGRLFSYVDTHRHRLGTNYAQLRVNRPQHATKTYTRDGPMCFAEQDGAPNYFPNSFSGPEVAEIGKQCIFSASGDVVRHDSGSEDNYSQANIFWNKVLSEPERHRLVDNIASHLINASKSMQYNVVVLFTNVDPDFGQMITRALIAKAEQSISKNVI